MCRDLQSLAILAGCSECQTLSSFPLFAIMTNSTYSFFFFFRWDEWEKALVLQHVMAHKPLLSRWFPTLWRAESNPRGFTLCSQKQPSFACPMLQLLLSQWWAGCVLLQSLQKMGPLQSNFLSYLQSHFVSSLVRTGSNIWLQRQLLAWASFQARWK